MIWDRLVVGLRDNGISEKLQMDSELTLAKTVLRIRQHGEKKTANDCATQLTKTREKPKLTHGNTRQSFTDKVRQEKVHTARLKWS